MALSASRCDCCGLEVEPGVGSDCPRCGYPVNEEKEAAFLRTSLYDLGRVARYGGANMTVMQLIDRYQHRLANLSQTMFSSTITGAGLSAQVQQRSGAALSQKPEEADRVQHSIAMAGTRSSSHGPVFAARTVFADQSINIVASLGAFLILIGSLSFIITTADLLFACIVLLAAHALFGSVGAITYRFASLRIVSIIYTAIFALQVPLVGFAVYRSVIGSSFHLSTALLIALAAGYATITYGALSVYQRFKPFGYLAAAALVVADQALAAMLHLAIWWWPVMLLLLVFPLQISLYGSASRVLRSSTAHVLREPAQVLLGCCVVVGSLAALFATLHSLSGAWEGVDAQSQLRFSVAVTSLLITGWLGLFIAQTKRYKLMSLLPDLFTVCLLAVCYALYAARPIYVLALTALAFLACGLARLLGQRFHSQTKLLERHLELLAVLIVSAMPFIAAPELFNQLIEHAYFRLPSVERTALPQVVMDVVILLLCCILVLSIVMRHTGWRKVLTDAEARWCGLLLVCGFLLNYALAIVLVALDIVPVWAVAGFLMLCLVLTAYAWRYWGAAWSNPLDGLVVCVFVETMLLGLGLDAKGSILLLLPLAILFYASALYRRQALMIPCALFCGLVALPHLFFTATLTLLVLALLLPLISAGIHHMLVHKSRQNNLNASEQQIQWQALAWEWPLLLTSIAYGGSLAWYDSTYSASVLQNWFVVPVPAALELMLAALAWYVAGMLVGKKWWVGLGAGFALWGLVLVPQTLTCQPWIYYQGMRASECLRQGQLALYSLAGVALIGAVLGLLIDGFAMLTTRVGATLIRWRIWSWPWYLVSLEAIATLLVWSAIPTAALPGNDLLIVLYGLVVLAVIVMLVKRMPEALILVSLLAARAIGSTPWLLWQHMVFYSILCILIFSAQFTWRILPPAPRRVAPASSISAILAIGGQALIVLVIILAGGLFAKAGILTHVGAGSLVVLAVLIGWWGYLQTEYMLRRGLMYSAGLLCTLAVPWELAAFAQTQLSTLWLAPASYLIVVAPFLTRDERLVQHQRVGQLCALAGAALLLLPTLWLSFSQDNLQPSLLLAGESLFLLLLGFMTRTRIFALSGTGLFIITALHVFFLPTLGIPTFLALSLMGLFLLALATILVLIRARLATLWSRLT